MARGGEHFAGSVAVSALRRCLVLVAGTGGRSPCLGAHPAGFPPLGRRGSGSGWPARSFPGLRARACVRDPRPSPPHPRFCCWGPFGAGSGLWLRAPGPAAPSGRWLLPATCGPAAPGRVSRASAAAEAGGPREEGDSVVEGSPPRPRGGAGTRASGSLTATLPRASLTF